MLDHSHATPRSWRPIDVVRPRGASAGANGMCSSPSTTATATTTRSPFPLLTRHGVRAALLPLPSVSSRRPRRLVDELRGWAPAPHGRSLPQASGPPPPRRALPLGPEQDATIAGAGRALQGLDGIRTDRLRSSGSARQAGADDRAARSPPAWITGTWCASSHIAGMASAGHTVTHPILARPRAPIRARYRTAARGSRQYLVASRCAGFASPVGSRDATNAGTQRILAEHGVELAFRIRMRFASFACLEAVRVPRVHLIVEHGPTCCSDRTVPQLFRAPIILHRAHSA